MATDLTGKTMSFTNCSIAYDETESRNAVDFNGSTALISFADDSAWDFGTGAFCIEVLFKTDTVADGLYTLVSQYQALTYKWYVSIYVSGGTTYIALVFYNGGGDVGPSWGTTITAGTLHHIAVVNDGGYWKCYRDGAQRGSAYSASAWTTLSGALHLGEGNSGSTWFDGKMFAVRITKGDARYTGAYTVPTSFDVDTGNVVLCTNFETAPVLTAVQDGTHIDLSWT